MRRLAALSAEMRARSAPFSRRSASSSFMPALPRRAPRRRPSGPPGHGVGGRSHLVQYAK